MYLSGSKVIAILCIITAISSAIEVLTELQQQNFIDKNSSKNTSYEVTVLNEFLDYNHLQRAVIIYTSSTFTSSMASIQQEIQDNAFKDNFVQLPLIRKLTENYHIQFVNTLSASNAEYLFQSLKRRIVIFMKYVAEDKGKNKILKFASMNGKFNNAIVWLLLMVDIDEPLKVISEQFGHLNIMLDADITVALCRKEFDCRSLNTNLRAENALSTLTWVAGTHCTVFANLYNLTLDLYDVYKICPSCGSPLEIEYKGNWSIARGFSILNKFHYGISIRRNNFKNYPVKAATAILNKPYNLNVSNLEYLNNDKNFMEDDAMQRKTYQLLKLMENIFNFTFDIYFNDKWGAPTNSGWTGVIGQLHRHEVELSLCPLRYLIPRLAAVHYSRNMHTEKIHFLFRHPKHTSIRNIFFEPLADIVWWCILALIVVTILMLAIHVHIEYKLFTELQRKHLLQQQIASTNTTTATTAASTNTRHRIKSAAIQFQFHSDLVVESHFDFIVLCIMEAILMQGPAPELFRCSSTRLLIVSLSIFSILLMQFYGAFIVSSLLSEPPRTITNLQALYNSSLEIGMENVPYNYEIFINSSNSLVQNLYKYRICNKHANRHNIMTLEEGVKRIGKGNFAFHVAIDRAYRLLITFLTETQFCDLQEVNFHPSFTFNSAIGIRKSSPYYEFITLAIAMFQESGLLPYNDKKWQVNKIDCTAIKSDEVEVDLEHFAPALAFLSFAMLISVIALAIELVYKKITIRKNFIILH